MSSYYSYDNDKEAAILQLRVKTNAPNNQIIGFAESENANYYLRLAIKAAPENGKANDSLIKFLAKSWQLTQCQLCIATGTTNRKKLLLIKPISHDMMERIIKDIKQC